MLKFFVWLLLIFLFVVRFTTTRPNYVRGQFLRVGGTLFREPNTGGGKTNFNLSGIDVALLGGQELHYGDYVSLLGKWDGERLVDVKIEKVTPSKSIFVRLRRWLTDFYERSLKQPDAGLVAGITIGAKSELTRSFSNRLRNTGTSHIVVASGTNVTLVGEFILFLMLSLVSRRKALLISIIVIWFYTLITGFEAPIIRASVMASIAFAGQIFGRVGSTLRVTFLSGMIMLILVPGWISDVGFLLSFSTTVSLILFNAKVTKMLSFVPNFVRQDLATSIAAQIGSMPIIYYFFGNLNLLSPLYNVAVLWTVPLIMIIGAVSGILSFVFPGLAKSVLQLVLPLTSWFCYII